MATLDCKTLDDLEKAAFTLDDDSEICKKVQLGRAASASKPTSRPAPAVTKLRTNVSSHVRSGGKSKCKRINLLDLGGRKCETPAACRHLSRQTAWLAADHRFGST